MSMMSKKSPGPINMSSTGKNSDKFYQSYSDVSIDGTMPTSGDVQEVRPQPQGIPLTPMAAGATLINLVLATGPFSYPYSFVLCSPLLGTALMAVVLLCSYMTAGFMVEALSISCAMRWDPDEDESERTIYPTTAGQDPEVKRKRDEQDLPVKNNPYYIREKIEISKMCDDHMHLAVKYVIFVVIAAYMYGAMIFKYVSGAESLSEGISFTFTGDKEKFDNQFYFYHICIFMFAAVSIVFSLGNIENSRMLQIFTMYARFLTTFLMIVGSLISMFFKEGITFRPVEDMKPDFSHASNLFANTVFVFVAHHSIAGIVKPVRPQKQVYNIIFYSFTIGAVILVLESWLAALAFSHIDQTECNKFPCEMQGLYNINFESLPVIGQITNFYPTLNVAAVPILTITLRNNLFVMFGITTNKETRFTKAIWSLGLSVPVIIVACVYRKAQVIMTYTGGLGGTAILFIIPCVMIIFARKNSLETLYNAKNFNKCYFQGMMWPIVGLSMAGLSLGVTIYGIATGSGGE